MKKLLTNILVLVTAVVVLSGCPHVQLGHTPLGKGDSIKGKLAIADVINLRETERGKENTEYLGIVRGGFGNPFDFYTEPGYGVDLAMKKLVTDAAQFSGYDTSIDSSVKAPSLEMEILTFWCDGYVGYGLTSILNLKLVSPLDKKILYEKKMEQGNGFALIFGYGNLYHAYDEIMDKIALDVSTILKSTEFTTAYGRSQ